MKYIIKILVLQLFAVSLQAQSIKGQVIDKSKKGVPGVIIFWKNNKNTAVSTDITGNFNIAKIQNQNILIFSSIGFKQDSILVTNDNDFLSKTILEETNDLSEVVVTGNATVIDKLSPIHTEVLTSLSLAKAACCNLSESFETNASVSVSYSDAVTGAKQIQLLGLAGTYVQTNVENIPNIRGLASTFGLNYIPGTWIQSIDIAKGIGSVVNGYENIGGGINVELKKPENSEGLLLNMYVNNFGRAEANLNLSQKLNKKWSVGLLSHGSFLKSKIDNNGDGFLDLPKYDQINIMNRWKYSSDNYMVQFGVKILNENRLGGQNDFESRTSSPNIYGFTNNTKRIEFFSKTAKLFIKKPYRGLGLILNAVNHASDTYFGFKPYLAQEKMFYTNLIYQDIFGNTNHTYKTGLSFLNDNFHENYNELHLSRNEIVPGAFFEYTYNRLDRTVILLGVRNDYHNLFGNQISPRIHIKQEISQNDVVRLSAGRGFRVPNLIAEAYGNLVSSRNLTIVDKLQPEIAWTFGGSYIKTIGKLTLTAEYYKTIFEKQWVLDMEKRDYLYYYISEGKAFANSKMVEINYQPNKRWEFKIAYKNVENKWTEGKPLNEKVLVDKMYINNDRVLFNVAYALPYNKWKFDYTLQWNGKRRIPNMDDTEHHTSYYAMQTKFAPAFINMNAQVTRTFPQTEWYLGGENLTNFKQTNPILNPEKPFSSGFDAGQIWGPVVGVTIYIGFRYKIL